MLIKRDQAQIIENSDSCTVREYNSSNNIYSFATACIDGSYPDSGDVANVKCIELCYVISGSGILETKKGKFNIGEGDFFQLDKGERYRLKGNKLELSMVNFPPFDREQHKFFD